MAIALALTASAIALERHDFYVAQEIFFFVTYLSSLTLLINGSTAEFLIVKLKLVKDPREPPSLLERFIAIRMDMSVRQRLKKFLTDAQHELGSYDESELGTYCPLLKKRLDYHDPLNLSLVANPLRSEGGGGGAQPSAAVNEEVGLGGVRNTASVSVNAVDATIILYLRQTYLNVRIPSADTYIYNTNPNIYSTLIQRWCVRGTLRISRTARLARASMPQSCCCFLLMWL